MFEVFKKIAQNAMSGKGASKVPETSNENVNQSQIDAFLGSFQASNGPERKKESVGKFRAALVEITRTTPADTQDAYADFMNELMDRGMVTQSDINHWMVPSDVRLDAFELFTEKDWPGLSKQLKYPEKVFEGIKNGVETEFPLSEQATVFFQTP